MTLHAQKQWTIPRETIRVAKAAFPKGNIYMTMYEKLGQLYEDEDFQELYPARCGQSALSPARLALITVMQFSEGLSDRQAAEAVPSRIDWKYVLGLELTNSGFDHTVIYLVLPLIGKRSKYSVPWVSGVVVGENELMMSVSL